MNLATFFDLDFWQQFITTAFGLIIGIPIAFGIEHCFEKRRVRTDRRDLVVALTDALEKNLTLVDQLIGELKDERKTYTPFYPMDLTVLDATAARRYELLDNVDLTRTIEATRYELIHLDGKLALLRESGSRILETANFYQAVRASIRLHLPPVKKGIQDCLKLMNQ